MKLFTCLVGYELIWLVLLLMIAGCVVNPPAIHRVADLPMLPTAAKLPLAHTRSSAPAVSQKPADFPPFIYPTNRESYRWSLEESDDLSSWQTVDYFYNDFSNTNPYSVGPLTNSQKFYRMKGE